MIVETWMNREPISVAVDTTVRAAAALMNEHAVRHLPVVHDDRVVGIVTRSDLLRGQAIDPFSLAAAHDPAAQRLVRAVMASPAQTVAATAVLQDAVAVMVARSIGALPVVRDSGSLVGILTATDALRALITSLQVEGPSTCLVFDGADPDGLLVALVGRARTLRLSIVGVQLVTGAINRELIVTVKGPSGDRLADAAWSAGYRVKSVTARQG